MAIDNRQQFHFWYFIAAVLLFSILQSVINSKQSFTEIPYSEFQNQLASNNIERVQISDSRIVGEYKSADHYGNLHFSTNRIPQDLAQELATYEVEYGGVIEKPSVVGTLLSWIVPPLIFVGIWLLIMKRFAGKLGGMGGMTNVGKSKAKVMLQEDTGVTFDDVAGVDEAKIELVEVVNFLKDPQSYGRLGAKVPKGVLLVGPPGTGKTLMARAVAGQAGVPFFSISGSEFVEMFVGVGAARVRDLFEDARKRAPAIIFIDELDALGGARAASPIGGHNEREQTLNQLLVELDGFDATSGVVLLAATNRPEILDPALLRAGRFDRQVLLDKPDKVGRLAILAIHLKHIQCHNDVNPEEISALTPGFTGADLANLANEAALLATRRNADSVSMDDFNSAIERIVAGLEKRNRLLNPKEREIVAYHEIGHALVSMVLPESDTVHKVSIIPRGIGSLGYTISRPTEDRFLMSRTELDNKITILLAGRAAEMIIFKHLSTGASDDIAKASDIARGMVTRYGMDTKLGSVAYETQEGTNLLGNVQTKKDYSEATALTIDNSIREIIEYNANRAQKILQQNESVLEVAAKTLLEKETLDEAELKELMKNLVFEKLDDPVEVLQ